jgi:hypothetical protein
MVNYLMINWFEMLYVLFVNFVFINFRFFFHCLVSKLKTEVVEISSKASVDKAAQIVNKLTMSN